MNKQNELEEKLSLMENNNYSNTLGRIMLLECLKLLTGDYPYQNFDKQMNRYLRMEVKYK